MTRILIVDDDRLVRKSLATRLRRCPDLDARFAAGTAEALGVMARQPIDVLLTDLRMPELGGEVLLKAARRHFPNQIRLAMSGHMDRGGWARMTPLVHGAIQKPCSWPKLSGLLRVAVEVQTRVRSSGALPALGELDGLPATPALFVRLGEALADPSVGLNEVGAMVEKEPAVAAQVLRIANSAWLGIPRAVRSIREALTFLGIVRVRELALAAELHTALGRRAARAGLDLRRAQADATRTGHLAGRLVHDAQPDVASTAGLLLGAGTLALAAAAPAQWRQVNQRVALGSPDRAQAERDQLGCEHSAAGALVLTRWGLPLEIVHAVGMQSVQPSCHPSELDVAAACYVAQRLTLAHRSHWSQRSSALQELQAWLDAHGEGPRLAGWRRLTEDAPSTDAT